LSLKVNLINLTFGCLYSLLWHFPVLLFGAVTSTPAFSNLVFSMLPHFPFPRFQLPNVTLNRPMSPTEYANVDVKNLKSASRSKSLGKYFFNQSKILLFMRKHNKQADNESARCNVTTV